jgi:hypothetical protein
MNQLMKITMIYQVCYKSYFFALLKLISRTTIYVNMNTLPPELITIIFSFARTVLELLKFSLINKNALNIVRRESWPTFKVRLYNDNINTIIKHYNFANIEILNQIVYPEVSSDDFISFAKNVRHLYINSIDNIPLYYFTNISSLEIFSGEPILAKNIEKCITNNTTLKFSYVSIDTDALKLIKNCRKISLIDTFMTNEDIIEVLENNQTCENFKLRTSIDDLSKVYPYITNITKLKLECPKIKSLPFLPNLVKLAIHDIIDFNIFKQYSNTLRSISITNFVIPPEWYPYLGKIKKVLISVPNNEVCSEGDLMCLKNCESLYYSGKFMTNNVLKSFTNIKKLHLEHCSRLNIEENLPDTIEDLSLEHYDFNFDAISRWQHLSRLYLVDSAPEGDYNLLKKLTSFKFNNLAFDRADELKQSGVKIRGSFAMDSCDYDYESEGY